MHIATARGRKVASQFRGLLANKKNFLILSLCIRLVNSLYTLGRRAYTNQIDKNLMDVL